MAEASVAVTVGAGTLLHTNTRTISASTMHDEYVLPGEYPYAAYIANAFAISTATANDHVLQLMAGAALNVRIRRIRIEQAGNATAVAVENFSFFRLTTAGTGGTAVTPAKLDNADAASGATAMTLPTAKGTEGVEIMRTTLVMRQALLATATQPEELYEWVQHPSSKPIIIPAGATNGFAVKILNAVAAGTVIVSIEFVETAFV